MVSSEHDDTDLKDESPPQRRLTLRRALKLFIAVDLLIVLVVAGWLLVRADNGGKLEGSKPPADQRMPDLSGIEGVEPAVPAPAELRGEAVAIIGTCLDCRSGEIIMGFVSRLGEVPSGSRVIMVQWLDKSDSGVNVFNNSGGRIKIHAVGPTGTRAVKDALNIGDSGIAYLYDKDGVWRSTFHLGQLERDAFLADLEELASE
jgi:hypothetical protein